MSDTTLPDLERRAYRSVMDDGILDLLVGAVLVGLGVTIATDLDYLSIVVVLLAPALWRLLRTRVVEPRQGYVRLQESRVRDMKRRKRTFGITLFALAVGLWLFDRRFDEAFPALHDYRFLLVGLLFTFMVAYAGKLFAMPRYYLYAAVGMLTVVLGTALGWPDSIGFFGVGGIMMAGGAWLLFRIASLPVVDDHD